jgi:hypothetical protein
LIDPDALRSDDRAPVPQPEEIREDAKRALESLQTIGTLVLTSQVFRSILADSVLVLRDVFAAEEEEAGGEGGAQQQQEENSPENEEDGKSKNKNNERGEEEEGNRDSGNRRSKQKGKQQQQEKREKQQQQQESYGDVARRIGRQTKEYFDEKTPDDVKDEAVERLKHVSRTPVLYSSSPLFP